MSYVAGCGSLLCAPAVPRLLSLHETLFSKEELRFIIDTSPAGVNWLPKHCPRHFRHGNGGRDCDDGDALPRLAVRI